MTNYIEVLLLAFDWCEQLHVGMSQYDLAFCKRVLGIITTKQDLPIIKQILCSFKFIRLEFLVHSISAFERVKLLGKGGVTGRDNKLRSIILRSFFYNSLFSRHINEYCFLYYIYNDNRKNKIKLLCKYTIVS